MCANLTSPTWNKTGPRKNETIHYTYWIGDAAGSGQCGYRPDGAQAIPQGAYTGGLWANFVLRLALQAADGSAQPGIHHELAGVQRRVGAVDAREFRLRVEPRTCAVGHRRLRIPRHSCTQLRRYFLQQLFQKRNSAGHPQGFGNRGTLQARRSGSHLYAECGPTQPDGQRLQGTELFF